VYPAVSDPGGIFLDFQVDPVEVEIYEPINFRKRMPESKRTRIGKAEEGMIRGGTSYGRFENGWGNESGSFCTETRLEDNR
jgi:hypothetical protein